MKVKAQKDFEIAKVLVTFVGFCILSFSLSSTKIEFLFINYSLRFLIPLTIFFTLKGYFEFKLNKKNIVIWSSIIIVYLIVLIWLFPLDEMIRQIESSKYFQGW